MWLDGQGSPCMLRMYVGCRRPTGCWLCAQTPASARRNPANARRIPATARRIPAIAGDAFVNEWTLIFSSFLRAFSRPLDIPRSKRCTGCVRSPPRPDMSVESSHRTCAFRLSCSAAPLGMIDPADPLSCHCLALRGRVAWLGLWARTSCSVAS